MDLQLGRKTFLRLRIAHKDDLVGTEFYATGLTLVSVEEEVQICARGRLEEHWAVARVDSAVRG